MDLENIENTDLFTGDDSFNKENDGGEQHNREEENRFRGDRRPFASRESADKDTGNGNNRKRFFKKKVCYFCKNNIDVLDYKDTKLLKRYIKDSGKIIPKRLNGTCSKHQRLVTRAIKRARNMALLPYETRY